MLEKPTKPKGCLYFISTSHSVSLVGDCLQVLSSAQGRPAGHHGAQPGAGSYDRRTLRRYVLTSA